MAGKKAKGNREQVILECTEKKESGLPETRPVNKEKK